MPFSNDTIHFLPELLHKVIAHVVGNSVHAICTFPGDVEWELHIFNTLRAVSSSFKSITTEIFLKGFLMPQEKSENLSRLITTKFDYLRTMGMRRHRPLDYDGSFPSPNAPLGAAPLMRSYALFIAAMDLRSNAVHDNPEAYELASTTILKALEHALGQCKRIEPEAIAEVICTALKNEQELAQNGLEIVKAFSNLRNHLGSYRESADGSLARMQSTFIHEELQVIESVHQRYTQVIPTHKFTPGGAQHQISELPGVLPVLRDLCALQFETDEYNFRGRLDHLVNEWSVSCPFLDA